MNRKAFTLIEVLIATVLLSIVLMGLYSVLDTQRRSVFTIKKNLDDAIKEDRAVMVLYNDILKSDGNITIKKSQRDTLCINRTTNSLYGLDVAKVCWLVLKQKDTLSRVEGNDYSLPLKLEDKVELDKVMQNVELFDITRDKKSGNILVVVAQQNKEPFSFLLQNIKEPPKPKPKKKVKRKTIKRNGNKKENNTTRHNDSIPQPF